MTDNKKYKKRALGLAAPAGPDGLMVGEQFSKITAYLRELGYPDDPEKMKGLVQRVNARQRSKTVRVFVKNAEDTSYERRVEEIAVATITALGTDPAELTYNLGKLTEAGLSVRVLDLDLDLAPGAPATAAVLAVARAAVGHAERRARAIELDAPKGGRPRALSAEGNAFIVAHPEMTNMALGRKLGIDPATVRRYKARLRAAGELPPLDA